MKTKLHHYYFRLGEPKEAQAWSELQKQLLGQGQDFSKVGDIPSEYAFERDSQDVYATLEYIGRLDEYRDTGSLFTLARDGEIVSVYQCHNYVPLLEAPVYKLL
jgi:hypothetical protein